MSPEPCSFLPVLPGLGRDKGLCCILNLTLLSSLCCQAFPRRVLQAALESFIISRYFCWELLELEKANIFTCSGWFCNSWDVQAPVQVQAGSFRIPSRSSMSFCTLVSLCPPCAGYRSCSDDSCFELCTSCCLTAPVVATASLWDPKLTSDSRNICSTLHLLSFNFHLSSAVFINLQ